jgi:hypothetical protein
MAEYNYDPSVSVYANEHTVASTSSSASKKRRLSPGMDEDDTKPAGKEKGSGASEFVKKLYRYASSWSGSASGSGAGEHTLALENLAVPPLGLSG